MKKLILIYLLFYAGITSKAQSEKIILPSDLKQQTIINEPVTLRKGYFRPGITLSYMVQDKYFDENGKKQYRPTSLWGSYYSYNFSLNYGLSDRFEIDLLVPFVNNRLEGYSMIRVPPINMDISLSSNLKSRGLSDCRLRSYYQIIPEKEKRISLTAFGDVTFPTGKKNFTDIKDLFNYKMPNGYGNFTGGAGLLARKIFYPYAFTSTIEYYYNFQGTKLISPADASETKFKTGNIIILRGSFNLQLNEWIALTNEIQYFHQGKSEEKYEEVKILDSLWDLDYLPRLVFQVRRFRISEFVMVPLFGKNTDADPGYSMSVQYTF